MGAMNLNKSTLPLAPSPQIIIDFWFADGLQTGWPTQNMKALWFGGGLALDARITAAFGEQVLHAMEGGFEEWEAQPLSRMALIVLLDQFTRNVFRGSPRAFEGDDRAQRLALDALVQAWDQDLPVVCRVFLYMPLMHAETLALQDQCVACFAQLAAEAPEGLKPRLQGNLDFARQHHGIIARFGRFPHRHAVLGRVTTPDEGEFLLTGPRFGQ